MTIVEAIAKLEELRKQHGDSFEVDILIQNPSPAEDTAEETLVFNSTKRCEIPNLPPETIVVLEDEYPNGRIFYAFCRLDRLLSMWDYAERRNSAIVEHREVPQAKDWLLIDQDTQKIICEANSSFIAIPVYAEDCLETNLPEGFTLENMKQFCKRANEFRQKQKC